MFKFHRNITLERLDKFVSEQFYSDVNLNSRLVKHRSSEALKFKAFKVPNLLRITFDEARNGQYEDAKVGDLFGPSWATVWFRVDVKIPQEWLNEEVVLRWDCSSEAMVWSADGQCLQGLTGGNGNDRRVDFRLSDSLSLSDCQQFYYIEMACNGMFGCADGSDINPPNPDRQFVLKTAELVVMNRRAQQLLYKFKTIAAMAKELNSAESQRGAQALKAANAIINATRTDDESTWSQAESIAEEFLTYKASSDAVHSVVAVGHCHIDTAWLWTYAETKRKCARSWSSQLQLMDRYPEFKFACSQAAQFEWVKQDYPLLFERIKQKVQTGQFIPVGGTWVEMDGNIPSGESFCRQFLYGQRFFEHNFGSRSKTFWLPDTFGYAAQLPQIMKLGGCDNFLTQKLSWNNINKFPHTTFWWHGLDATRVLTHFPPADTYCAQSSVKEILYGVRNHKDKEHSNTHMLLTGNGDGGGGTTENMIESLRTMKNVNGLPKVQFGSPDEFFAQLRGKSDDFVSWKSELYFELHRGTYTSQAKNKLYNRQCEFLLRDVEYLAVLASNAMSNFESFYPKGELDRLWKIVMLNQFHDVLPGSSIELVYQDSNEQYNDVLHTGGELREKSLHVLMKNSMSLSYSKNLMEMFEACLASNMLRGKTLDGFLKQPLVLFCVNTLQFDRKEVIEVDIPSGVKASELPFAQIAHKKNKGYVLAQCNGFGSAVSPLKSNVTSPVAAVQQGSDYVLENNLVKAVLSANGRLLSFFDKVNSREVIPLGEQANRFIIHPDQGLFWQAWDVECYHLEQSWDAGLGVVSVIENGPLKASLEVTHPLSKASFMKQVISLDQGSCLLDFACEVDWHESHKLLKVCFPLNVMSDVATYETAFGHVQRPTHFNTSHDFAKFEVCGHKYADLSEFGYGVALLNDCKYGYSTYGNVMRLSLLRSPKAPDAHCDIGHHQFKYALYPHKGSFLESDVVQEGLKFNCPLLTSIIPLPDNQNLNLTEVQVSQFNISSQNLVIDTIKRAEDSNAIIVRIYEAYGGRGVATFQSVLRIKSVDICNILEDVLTHLDWSNQKCSVIYKPFQVITLKLTLM